MLTRAGSDNWAKKLQHFYLNLVLMLGAASGVGQPAGALDASFDPGSGVEGAQGGWINHVTVATNGQILGVGVFDRCGGISAPGAVLLNANGSMDAEFRPSQRIAGTAAAFLGDGRVLAVGLLSYGRFPSARHGLVRFNGDGTLDTNFVATTRVDDFVTAVALQRDGRVLLTGNFSTVNGTPRNRIARIDANGLLDVAFDPGSGIGVWRTNWIVGETNYGNQKGGVTCVALQSDGYAMVGGDFIEYDGIPRLSLARVDPLGKLDLTYDPASALGITRATNGSSANVWALAIGEDDKATLAYTIYGSTTYVARIRKDGNLDNSFQISTIKNAVVDALALRKDGRVVLVGSFTNIQGVARSRVAQLNSDGKLDESFVCEPGPDAEVYSVALQANEDIVIGGRFTTVGSVERRGIARLLGNNRYQLLQPRLTRIGCQISVWTVPGKTYVLERCRLLCNPSWTALILVLGDGTVRELVDPDPPEQQGFYRVRIE